jgi:hypothetical protein
VSPFAKVKGGPTTTPERVYYVSSEEIETAIKACGADVELAGILALARYAGLRIPSEIKDLRFTDFEDSCFSNGTGIFRVPVSGKTGTRRVPLFNELIPHLKAIQEKSKPEQEFVFEKYRSCKNIGTLIKKKMQKAGLKVWEKFFINQRSSCQTDKERLGWSRSVMDAVFGNSEAIRIQHYIQPLPDEDYAKLGQQNANNSASINSSIEIPIIDRIFEGQLTYSDMLAAMNLDSKACQKVMDVMLADPELSIGYANISAIFKTVYNKSFYELPQEEQLKRANTFVQNAAQHYEKFITDFSSEMEDNGLEPMTFWLPARKGNGASLLLQKTCDNTTCSVHSYVHSSKQRRSLRTENNTNLLIINKLWGNLSQNTI